MKRSVPILLLVVLVGAAASAQPNWPQHGDLVVAVGGNGGGYTGYLNPVNPGTLTPLNTIAQAPANCPHLWVRMAPNNSDLVVAGSNRAQQSDFLLNIRRGAPQARISTLASLPGVRSYGWELDEDGWIAAAKSWSTQNPNPNFLLHLSHGTPPTLTKSPTLFLSVEFREIAIDRDLGLSSPPYVVVISGRWGAGPHPIVLRADRRGNVTTILTNPPSSFTRFRCVEVHPRSGDLLLLETGVSGAAGLLRMDKACTTVTTLLPGLLASALKITQDDFVWIAANLSERVLKYDLVKNAVVATYPLVVPSAHALQSIDVYGSRPLYCHKVSASTVNVNVQSRHPFLVPNQSRYALAASFARRPGIQFAHGEWLDLDVTNPLFFVSALGLLPGTFSNFQGNLSVSNGVGTATAKVNIPAMAQGLKIPIFVAGVIFDQNGVFEVTNTHWFVL